MINKNWYWTIKCLQFPFEFISTIVLIVSELLMVVRDILDIFANFIARLGEKMSEYIARKVYK